MLWEILFLMLIIRLVQRRWLMRQQLDLAEKLKSNLKSYPIVGHSWIFLGTDEHRMRSIERLGRDAIEAGGICTMWQLNQLDICVADPVVAEILTSQCLEKHEILNLFQFIIGNGSIFAPVSIWRPRRKILTPIFSSKNLNQFVEMFSEQSNVMMDCLQKVAGKGPLFFWNYIYAYNMDTVCENILGFKINAQTSQNQVFVEALDALWEIGTLRITQPWFRSHFMFQFMPCYKSAHKYRSTVWDFIKQIIKQKQKVLWETNNQQIPADKEMEDKTMFSFLDSQLEASDDEKKLTETELLEEIIVLVVAAADTSATSVGFTALMLCRHPDIQGKVYDELLEVFGDSTRPVSAKDLPQLKYLEAVIRESLRLFPPVPVIARKAHKDVTLPSGLTILKNCGIVLNIWAINRNPEYWGSDADQFRPERFLDDTPKHPSAFSSFSYKPRGCIGYQYSMMSMKTVLATLLRRYRVVTPRGVNREEPLRTKFNLMLRHVDNFEIELENRK